MVVNKPCGLLTEGRGGNDWSLAGKVKAYLRAKYEKNAGIYLGVIHRLDKIATGVVIFARNSKAAARLAEQFRNRTVRKIYWAWLEKTPTLPAGTLIDWLLEEKAFSKILPTYQPGAKECVLHYRVLDAFATGECVVEVELSTGRQHQIRAQLAHLGCPVLGDDKYGAVRLLPPLQENCHPILLHARSLTFLHPIRYDTVTVVAPLPTHWPPWPTIESP